MRAFDGLGYRGLIVLDPGDPASLLKVGFGLMVRANAGAESPDDDEARALEAWLLATGKGKIDDRLMAISLDSLARPHK